MIAHIDLDAFYAQCEMVRLGVPDDQPLAVQQWQGLIAINYPARKFGLNRHVTTTEAQKACPEIIMQHVATWREGDEKWAYHENAFQNIATHKVSLDPYRLESRRILAVIKAALPDAPVQRVEKASVDEVFLDLSMQVHGLLLERYPELHGPAPYDDPTEFLPAPSTSALDWNADALVDLDKEETEEDAPDWDDIAMLLGSEIVRSLRAAVRAQLKYTCSAGIARNKMLAKLASGHRKPNQQTVIRNRAITQFLSDFKFTKIRNLGGKLGDEVTAMFSTDLVSELLAVPIDQLKRLGDDTGTWLYHTIRGSDTSEVNARTQIKSMLSAKSFRPSINAFDVGVKWLRIFVSDIFNRLLDDTTAPARRPKTMNLHHRQGAQSRSKQAPIPAGKPLDEATLFTLAKNLLAQVVADGRAWPCANLSLSVGGFEDAPTRNHGIGGFLLRGEDAKLQRDGAKISTSDVDAAPPSKRQKTERSLTHFFAREDSDVRTRDFEDVPSAQRVDESWDDADVDGDVIEDDDAAALDVLAPSSPVLDAGDADAASDADVLGQDKFVCDRCGKALPRDQKEEHDDWHFARALQEDERKPVPPRPPTQTQVVSQRGSASAAKGRGKPTALGVEKGQKRLAFG